MAGGFDFKGASLERWYSLPGARDALRVAPTGTWSASRASSRQFLHRFTIAQGSAQHARKRATSGRHRRPVAKKLDSLV